MPQIGTAMIIEYLSTSVLDLNFFPMVNLRREAEVCENHWLS